MTEQPVKQESLVRTFGLRMAIILVMSSIIGSGVFKKVTPMSEGLQSPTLVVLAWILAGVIVLFGVWSVAELASMFPHSGGPISWLEKIYGKFFSFLYGWSSFTVIQTAAIASVAYVFAGAMDSFIALPHLSQEWESFNILGIHFFENIGAKLITCLLIIALTLVNMRGAKHGGLISSIFTFTIVLCLAFIIAAALGSEKGSIETFATKGSDYPAEGFSLFAFISVMVIAMRNAFWGYEGWITLGFIGEEVKNPQKNLPRALTIGIILISVFYFLINFAYLYILPIDEIVAGAANNPNYIGAVAVIDKIFGNNGVYVVSGMILISTFGCTNATILVSARVHYAMSKKGLFFKGVDKVHNKNKTPHKALIYQGVWACVLTMSGSFDLLSDLVVFAAFVFYGLIVFGVIIMRKKRADIPRAYKTPGYPVIPIIFILFCILLLVISLIEAPTHSLVGLILIFSGLPFYFYWKKKERHLKYLEMEQEKGEEEVV